MERFTMTVVRGTETEQIPVSGGESILNTLRAEDYREPDAPCGGQGTCKKCLVTVTGRVRSADGLGEREVENEQLLACRYYPAGDLTVTVQIKEKMQVVTAGAGNIAPGGEGLGFAVDIGTTTVAAFLYDLATGKRLGAEGGRNAQRSYGADVISRITCASEGKLIPLRDAIRGQIAGLAEDLCKKTKHDKREIKRISIAGNTVM